MRINDSHESPALLASKGHAKVALLHPHVEPIAGPPASTDTPAYRRRAARERAKFRKREVRSGAPFLSLLTTTHTQGGIGQWQGESAPSRLPGHLPAPQ